jgi:hypothetical protein
VVAARGDRARSLPAADMISPEGDRGRVDCPHLRLWLRTRRPVLVSAGHALPAAHPLWWRAHSHRTMTITTALGERNRRRAPHRPTGGLPPRLTALGGRSSTWPSPSKNSPQSAPRR